MKFETLKISSSPVTYLVRINCDLNSFNSLLFDDHLLSLADKNPLFILIDMKKVERVTSNAIKAMLSTLLMLKKKEGDLILFEVNDRILRMLDLFNLKSLFTIKQSEEEAKEIISNYQSKN